MAAASASRAHRVQYHGAGRMRRESGFSKKIRDKLLEIPNTYVVRTQAGSIRGIPDLLICHKGRFIAWELKVQNRKPDKLQQLQIEKIIACGGASAVVTPENYAQHIKELKDGF